MAQTFLVHIFCRAKVLQKFSTTSRLCQCRLLLESKVVADVRNFLKIHSLALDPLSGKP